MTDEEDEVKLQDLAEQTDSPTQLTGMNEQISKASGEMTVPSKVTSVIAFVYENKKIWE